MSAIVRNIVLILVSAIMLGVVVGCGSSRAAPEDIDTPEEANAATYSELLSAIEMNSQALEGLSEVPPPDSKDEFIRIMKKAGKIKNEQKMLKGVLWEKAYDPGYKVLEQVLHAEINPCNTMSCVAVIAFKVSFGGISKVVYLEPFQGEDAIYRDYGILLMKQGFAETVMNTPVSEIKGKFKTDELMNLFLFGADYKKEFPQYR